MSNTAGRHLAGLGLIARLLRPYANGVERTLAAGASLGIATVALHVARPWPLKWMVDLISRSAHPELPGWIPGDPRYAVLLLGALFVGIASLGAAMEYLQTMMLNGAGNRILFRFRSALFGHLVQQPLVYHEGRDVGELLTRVIFDTSRMRRGVNGLLVKVFQAVALFVATLVVTLWLEPVLGLVLALSGVLAFAAMQRRGRQIARVSKRQRKREGALAALVASELAGVRELQTFGSESSVVLDRFGARNDKSLREEQKVRRLVAGLTMRVDIIIAFGVAVALALGASGALSGTLTPGDLVLFLSYALALRQPFMDFAYQTARVGRTYACAERLARITDRELVNVDVADAVEVEHLRGELRFDAVSVRAPRRIRNSRKWTLAEVAFEIPPLQRIAIVGGNGSGKSSLLRLVLRLAEPESGSVILDGRDVRAYAVTSLRRRMSVVFQDVMLPAVTIREVIALGDKDADDDRILRAAERAHARQFVERLPQGLDTTVRRGGDLFSGGERQRLAIAGALLRDGDLWLLDEPTTGLDPGSADAIVETLLEATKGRTTLWVTHDLAIIRRLDIVLAMRKGRVDFLGSPDAYFNRAARVTSGGIVTPTKA